MKDLTNWQAKALEIIGQHSKKEPIPGFKLIKEIRLVERERGKPGADMRSIVHALRTKGWPVCANSRGYWLAEDEFELSAFIKQFQARIDMQQQACNALKFSMDNVGKKYQKPPEPKMRSMTPEEVAAVYSKPLF